MTNETPPADGEPTESVPQTPPAAEPPVASEPATTPFTYDEAVNRAGDADDVDAAPTVAAPAVAAPAAAAPAAAAPGHAAAPPVAEERPAGIFIPKWVGLVAAAIVAALVFGGIGYAIGDSSSDSGSQNASSVIGNGQQTLPGNGNGPFGNGPRQIPGNGSGQSNGNGAFLGVALQTASNGAGIADVQSGSPAANAGLKTGDVITDVDGTKITNPAALVTEIQKHKSGDQITITYTRDGKSATAKVTLTSRSGGQSS